MGLGFDSICITSGSLSAPCACLNAPSVPCTLPGAPVSASAITDVVAPEPTGAGTRARPRRLPPLVRELLSLLAKVALITSAGLLALTFVYGSHRATGTDMAPSVKDGDVVLYYRPDKSYEQGDMAVLSYEGTLQVRRVVAVEGDSVDITKDGLVINGALQQEPDIYEETLRYTEGPILPLTLGKGEVFVLGDARKGATDSRAYGPVPAKDTLGTVIATIRHRGL